MCIEEDMKEAMTPGDEWINYPEHRSTLQTLKVRVEGLITENKLLRSKLQEEINNYNKVYEENEILKGQIDHLHQEIIAIKGD